MLFATVKTLAAVIMLIFASNLQQQLCDATLQSAVTQGKIKTFTERDEMI